MKNTDNKDEVIDEILDAEELDKDIEESNSNNNFTLISVVCLFAFSWVCIQMVCNAVTCTSNIAFITNIVGVVFLGIATIDGIICLIRKRCSTFPNLILVCEIIGGVCYILGGILL